MSIFPFVLLLFGLLGTVISLDCLWRTKGSLRKVVWILITMSALSVALSLTEFLVQDTQLLQVLIAGALVLIIIGVVLLAASMYSIIRSVQTEEK